MTTELSSYRDRELRWLEHWGFTDNPFAQCEASREADLEKYFFERFHDVIKGVSDSPQTCMVFADRGCGKTAQRVMIERTCQPHDRTSDILAVPYVRFAEAVERAGGDPRQAKLAHHVHQIVVLGVRQLLQMFFQNPNFLLDMQPEDQGVLSWFLANYGEMAWSPLVLLRQLREWNGLAAGKTFWDVQKALESRDIGQVLEADFVEGRRGQMLAMLVETKPIPVLPNNPSAVLLFETLVSLVTASRCNALYVLLDGLDELPETWSSVETAASFIRTLSHNTEIAEMPRVAFKFFLPTEMEAELEDVLQRDRFPAYRISWSDKDLLDILRARVGHFNTRTIDSLGALAEQEISDGIDETIVEYASYSPRRLISLGRDLIEQKIHAPSPINDQGVFITQQDLITVLERQSLQEYGSVLPPLSLKPDKNQVLIGERAIKLTSQQFEVMQLLYAARGEIKSKDDIAFIAYKSIDGVTDQAIDSLVYRMRQKIERDPKNPQYLVTVRGEGYRLQNTG